jgi:SHS family lactate transporter-like MFS transporter
MPENSSPANSRSAQFHVVSACFLGWALDSFDFFVIVFLFGNLATAFHVSKAAIIATTMATLATRPLGALLFGLLADRFGRRVPLMANIVFFSVVEMLCGFSPNYTVFFVLRMLYGIGMGGEWGVGASLALESVPARWRGVLSGLLQNGYSVGYLLAALAARFILPVWGWRAMFWAGGLPSLLALYIWARVPESEAWKQHRAKTTGDVLRVVGQHWKRMIYLVALMTFMMFLSHGTQDLYPDFLRTTHSAPDRTVSAIAILYCFGAVLGGVFFGYLSQRAGRRRSMVAALAVAILFIPLWAFSHTLGWLAFGAFFMQVGVQGAWGIIPIHLNELSPDQTRGLVPGLAYQLGNLIASPTNKIEYKLYQHFGYQWALASFELVTIVVLATLISLGQERRGRSFHEPSPACE